ncbi:hypothetical protein PI172_0167 [Prevotella intermedia]|uniref:Uncharacterized protein n=1 Tax=Prevotella intermedia TaxID=28131 RepID=A0AAD1F672_PREIN|nr:hypothetical protein PI172_0167 [Prevotella intermedia]
MAYTQHSELRPWSFTGVVRNRTSSVKWRAEYCSLSGFEHPTRRSKTTVANTVFFIFGLQPFRDEQ